MITLRENGNEHVIRALGNVADPARRIDLMDNLGSYGVSSTQQRFIEERGPDGKPWKKSFRAEIEGGKTLRDTARLFQSFTHEATKDSAAWGSNVAYAGIHQLGGDIKAKSAGGLKFKLANGQFVVVGKVTMPARPSLGINDDDSREIRDITQDWLQEAFK